MIDFIGDIHGHATELRALLKKLGAQLQGDDLATLNSIISDFAPY